MKLQRLPFFILAVLALTFAACDNTGKHSTENNSPAVSPTTSTNAANLGNANTDSALPKPDYIAIAQKVVTQCAGVKAGEIVQITGDVKDADLLEEIVLAVRKLGAFPLLQMGSYDEARTKRALTEMPESVYAQTDQVSLKLAGMVNARISITNYNGNNLSADLPQERIEALMQANKPIAELQRQRNIRNIDFGGNGLYPSKRNADRLGLSQAELAQIFWNGVNTDYAQLQATGEQYRQLLAASQEVHLTHANGTDLKVSIAQRPVFVSDGVVSPEDIKRGGPAVQVWLPAGEVYVTAVPGTAEGRVVIDHQPFNTATGDMIIEGLTLEFKAGKLVSMTARSGLEPFKKAYDKVVGAAGAGKDEFSFIDLGINRNLVLGPKAKGGDYAPAGMVSFGIGQNFNYGGTNKSHFGYEFNLAGGTLKLDGKVVVENGTLKQ